MEAGKNCLVEREIIALKGWFQEEKRDLPWRRDPSPYQVWISEVMLQQTQVAVVLPYFNRWMEQFPSISLLAQASLEEVIKAWEGLGYYSRARNIHAAAIYLTKYHGGELPSRREDLEKIKGLGPYTVGAILSFAFHQKAVAIDANVARVLSRFYLIEEDLSRTKVKQRLNGLVEGLLPSHEPWVVMEALIELGARICQKIPRCSQCPLQLSCQGALTGKAIFLPMKQKKISYIKQIKKAAVLLFGEEILLKKGEEGIVMADLYEFPCFEASPEQELGIRADLIQFLEPIHYSYTKYRIELEPTLWQVEAKKEVEGYRWITLSEIESLPFSSGHRRLLHAVKIFLDL